MPTCDDPMPVCPSGCAGAFSRVVVSSLIRGGTFVAWDLAPDFDAEGPYEFQLQTGRTANNDADDWVDVGLPAVNVFHAIDDQKRLYGQTPWMHYRVVLTTPSGTWYSEPTGMLGVLSKSDWLDCREILRQALVNLRKGHWGVPGFLLKRRVAGKPCQTCLDFVTQAVSRPDCPECYGTGYTCGYYYPQQCIWSGALEMRTSDMRKKENQGVIDQQTVVRQMVTTGLGVLNAEDLFVDLLTDERWFVHPIQTLMEYHGVPLVYAVRLLKIPYSSRVYEIDVPEQSAAITRRAFKYGG